MRTVLLSLLSLSLLAACSGPKNGVATDDGRFGTVRPGSTAGVLTPPVLEKLKVPSAS